MKMNKKQIFCAVLATAAVASVITVIAATPSAPLSAAAPTAAPDSSANSSNVMAQLFGDPVIVKGKGFEIKHSQLDEVIDGLKASAAAHGQTIPASQMGLIQGKFLDRLIQIQLLSQKATPADKAEGKKKTDEQVADLIKRAGSIENFDEQLKAVGMTADQLRTKMNEEVTAMVTLQREVGATVTDADVKNYYTNHPADFEQPEKIHVRHILLLTMDPITKQPLSDAQKAAKLKQAQDILKKARAGEDFAKLAEQYSEDPGSKADGGDLPPFDKDGSFGQGSMVPEFAAAAFALTNHEISDIVTTEYGYHIIQSLGKTPATTLKLTDKIPNSDETVADRLKEILASQKTETLAGPYLDKLEKDADVEILDPDLKADVAQAKSAAADSPAMPAQ